MTRRSTREFPSTDAVGKLFDRALTIFVDSDPRLRAGAFGRATIQIGRRCAPAIPLSAVLYGPSSA
jgi:hypothetical protein